MSSRNLTEGSLDKTTIAFRCPLPIKYKLLARFGGKGDMTKTMIAACEFATRGVELNKELIDRLCEEQAQAYKERMRARLERDMKKYRPSSGIKSTP